MRGKASDAPIDQPFPLPAVHISHVHDLPSTEEIAPMVTDPVVKGLGRLLAFLVATLAALLIAAALLLLGHWQAEDGGRRDSGTQKREYTER